MQAAKQLRPPRDWQAFEDLCKRLWGEIWNCPEIKKNGRSGQQQHGVDVYGVPFGETQFYGIQCKGKNDDYGSILTREEIDTEIEKAKSFIPALKKLYFATTAKKDVHIEEYIRQKYIQNRALGLFEVHLYSWEDIVDQIDANQQTLNWYFYNNNFKTINAAQVTFEDNQQTKQCVLLKRKIIESYSPEHYPVESYGQTGGDNLISRSRKNRNYLDLIKGFHKPKINKSYINFSIKLSNSGTVDISNYKLQISITGAQELEFDILYDYPKQDFSTPTFHIRKVEDFVWQLVPLSDNNILVQGDSYIFNSFSVRPLNDTGKVSINWRLLSSESTIEGSLTIDYETNFFETSKHILIPRYEKPRLEEKILDYYEDLKKQTNG